MTAETTEQKFHLGGMGEVVPSGPLMEEIEILGEHDGQVEAKVPTHMIQREDVAVDADHVEELVQSMMKEANRRGGTGQIGPVILAEVPGKEKFLIVDGFHRDAAIYKRGVETAFASIIHCDSEAEVLDLRIMTATIHTSVTFARVVEWIGNAWEDTPWARRLTATQAFSLSEADSTGQRFGVTLQESEHIKDWVADKCERWGIPAANIRGSLNTAELANPALVKEARPRKSSHKLEAITPQHLEVIATGLPDRHVEQTLVAEVVKASNLNIELTRQLVKMVSPLTSLEKIQELMGVVMDVGIKPPPARRTPPVRYHEPAENNPSTIVGEIEQDEQRLAEAEALSARLSKDLLYSELQVGALAIQNLVLRGDYVVPDERERLQVPRIVVEHHDPAIERILMTHELAPRLQEFLQRLESARQPLRNRLQAQAHLSDKDASVLIGTVAERITDDMAEGLLRYIGSVPASLYDRLLANGIRAELGQRHSPSHVAGSAAGRPRSALVTDLPGVLDRFPGFDPLVRKQLVLEGFMRLNASAARQALGLDSEAIDKLSLRLKARYADTKQG